MDKLKQHQLEKIEETLEDFKCLLKRYRELKDNPVKLNYFFNRNRNPIWDITNINFFKTGLKSEKAAQSLDKNSVDDHFIQRSKSIKFIFNELDKKEDMSLDEFIMLIRKLCSTIKLTREEHNKVTSFAKKNPTYLNYEIYVECGINVEGISNFIL
jgi:hypothetical protein